MGAQLWHHLTPWKPDPEAALFELQADFMARTYDLPKLVKEHLASALEAVRNCEADGDAYGLLDMYREKLTMLEDIAGRPLPTDPREQIDLIRAVFSDSGQGVGNVLDVTGVSDRGEMDARNLPEEEIRRYCSTDRPTIHQAKSAAYKINEILGRGESVCFPVYDEGPDHAPPVGWYFVGNTID